jgi:hypothetical protein
MKVWVICDFLTFEAVGSGLPMSQVSMLALGPRPSMQFFGTLTIGAKAGSSNLTCARNAGSPVFFTSMSTSSLLIEPIAIGVLETNKY